MERRPTGATIRAGTASVLTFSKLSPQAGISFRFTLHGLKSFVKDKNAPQVLTLLGFKTESCYAHGPVTATMRGELPLL